MTNDVLISSLAMLLFILPRGRAHTEAPGDPCGHKVKPSICSLVMPFVGRMVMLMAHVLYFGAMVCYYLWVKIIFA